jgi:hypothetical protein
MNAMPSCAITVPTRSCSAAVNARETMPMCATPLRTSCRPRLDPPEWTSTLTECCDSKRSVSSSTAGAIVLDPVITIRSDEESVHAIVIKDRIATM